ncbi:MAG: ABC transporter permease [Lachnospiraceae bacterium]|nr:ABC transporter permease [Lachnospiraceae bacterium]MBQ2466593.1 ABC transporter permease [Lachnospiraceae bacterium]
MNNKLIFRLIGSSMQKNKHIRIPFFLVGVFTLMVFYIISTLACGDGLVRETGEVFYGAAYLQIILAIGSAVIAVVSAILILYANVFIMKDRRREIGLYGILGLPRKSIVKLLTYEALLNVIICLGGGLLLGTFLNKLMLLTLYKLVGQAPVMGFFFSKTAFVLTIALGLGVYLVCLIYNILSIRLSKPVELLRSNQMGEKEPKVKWFTVISGLICVGAGYFLALTCKSTIDSIGIMFMAIMLVIVGTYELFTAGTIAILKAIKNNQKSYYQTKNFVGVANLMYRMKHNAAGLASICVLSSGVILLISCVASLVALGKQNIDMMCPSEVMVRYYTTDESTPQQLADVVAGYDDITVEDYQTLPFWNTVWMHTDDMAAGEFEYMDEEKKYDYNCWIPVYIVTEEMYNQHAKEELHVNAGEVYVFDTKKKHYDELKCGDQSYAVKGTLDRNAIRSVTDSTMMLFDMLYVLVPDEEAAQAMLAADPVLEDRDANQVCYVTSFNVDGKLTSAQLQEINSSLAFLGDDADIKLKQEITDFFMSLYGGALFVGVFMAIIFLVATVLIIYYKQMSEGFEDHHRYQILKKVGLTETEVRSSINRQVMILFFLPLVVAAVHISVASHIIRLFMQVIVYVEPWTFRFAIAGSIAVFALVYCLVYKVTSGQYFKIVDAAEHVA